MRSNWTLLLLLVLAPGCFSFEVESDLDPGGGEEKLVLNGLLPAGEVPFVEVSASMSILLNRYPFLPAAAVVTMQNLSSNAIDTLRFVNSRYKGSETLDPGAAYLLRAVHPNYPPVAVTLTFPEKTVIDSVSISYRPPNGVNEVIGVLQHTLFLKNRPEAQFFVLKTAERWRTRDTDFGAVGAGGDNSKGIEPPFGAFSDLFFSEETVSLTIETAAPQMFAEISQQYELFSIPESYFLYLKDLERQYELADNPFTEPVEVRSNVQNGLGMVAGVQRFSLTVVRTREELR